jgi:diamine N-acetyltransferase
MPTGLQIGRASRDDAALLAELGARTFRDAFGPDNDPDDMEEYIASTFTPARTAAELADPAATLLVAWAGAQAVGYAHLRIGQAPAEVRGAHPVELVRIYVDQRVIGSGYGSALMAACFAEARDRGCETVWLGVWEHNERAQAFYRRWGFVEVGSQEFVLGRDVQTDLIMQAGVR